MAPRSQLEIHTASLLRLVKEEASYHKELQQQTERIQRLEAANGFDDDDGNKEYTLKQEVTDKVSLIGSLDDWYGLIKQRLALEETKKVLPTMKKKIDDAVAKLDSLVVSR